MLVFRGKEIFHERITMRTCLAGVGTYGTIKPGPLKCKSANFHFGGHLQVRRTKKIEITKIRQNHCVLCM